MKSSSSKLLRFLIGFLIVFLLLAVGRWGIKTIFAEIDCQNTNPTGLSAGDAQTCADQLQNLINLYLPAQNTNKKNLATLQSQLADIGRRTTALTSQIGILTANISKKELDIAYTQTVFDQKAREQYKFLRLYDPVAPFIFADSASQAFQEISLRQKAIDSDRKTMEKYATDLAQFKADQVSLQKSKDSLAASQKQVADKTSFLAAEVAKVDTYLASLSAKQSAFIAAKLQSLGLSRSAYNLAGGCSDDRNVDPGFSPRIAFFSFGVPNRVGMSQYGAKGRADAGQSSDQILKAYYNFDSYQNFPNSLTIKVQGYGNYSLEDYVKRIYEVPGDWPMEALKAQAVAARSYALAYTNNGAGSICTTQSCQVFQPNAKGGAWEQAVNATAGQVMIQGGQPIKAWFSASHGGYAFNSGDIGWSSTPWTKRVVDTTSGTAGSFSDLFNNAYDRSSPVFYCDWGARFQYSKTAWLKPDELADIANAVLLAEKDGSTKSHLYQPDKPNPEGTDTWDSSRVRSELSSRGGSPIGSANEISVNVDFSTGRTTSVSINGQTINGDDFKNYFNLRAPANIQIVGPLFNVEKR